MGQSSAECKEPGVVREALEKLLGSLKEVAVQGKVEEAKAKGAFSPAAVVLSLHGPRAWHRRALLAWQRA
jgi:hypothetical protein